MLQKIFEVVKFVLYWGLAGLGFWWLIQELVVWLGGNGEAWFMAVLLLPFMWILMILIHELGHLVGALYVGFTFRLITIGPWSIIKMPDGFQHRLNFKVLAILGGQQLSTPDHGIGTDRQYLIYLAGGGVANLVAAGLASLGFLLPLTPFLVPVLVLFVGVNVLLGATNLVPFCTAQGMVSDGFNMREILRKGPGAVYIRSTFAIFGYSTAAVHPRDWSPQVITDLREGATALLQRTYATLMEMVYAIETKDLDRARLAALTLELLIEKVPTAAHAPYAVELAYYFGCVDPDVEKSTKYANLASKGGYLLSETPICRAEAAAAFASGQYEACIAACELGMARADQCVDALSRTMEPVMLAALRTRAMEAMGSETHAA